MAVKTWKKKLLVSEKTKLAVTAFMSSTETRGILSDPKEREALKASTARIRRIAAERREAQEIPLLLHLKPCTI